MSGVSNTQPLRDLAERVMRDEGWALADLARNASGARQKSWFGKVIGARHRATLLREDEIDALAAGLRVSAKVVRTADLAGHGLMELDGSTAAAVVPEAAELTPRQMRAVHAVIRAMLEPYSDETVVPAGSLARRTLVRPVEDVDVAARGGQVELAGPRGAQDEDAERPHPEPSDHPA